MNIIENIRPILFSIWSWLKSEKYLNEMKYTGTGELLARMHMSID
jgi:hypothetical protein